MKRNSFILLISFISFHLSGQTGNQRIIKDGDRKFVYSDSSGVTESYKKYFGDSFSVPGITTYDGKRITAADRMNKTVFYNFWFVNCRPCVAEIPVLNRLADKYKGDSILFIAITFDKEERIREFLQNHEFAFQIASIPQEEIEKIKKISFYPFSAITGRDGKLSFALFGRPAGRNQEDELFRLLDKQVEAAILK